MLFLSPEWNFILFCIRIYTCIFFLSGKCYFYWNISRMKFHTFLYWNLYIYFLLSGKCYFYWNISRMKFHTFLYWNMYTYFPLSGKCYFYWNISRMKFHTFLYWNMYTYFTLIVNVIFIEIFTEWNFIWNQCTYFILDHMGCLKSLDAIYF